MAHKFSYYAIIGNNGYGLSREWEDILGNTKRLENEWHKGFNTKDDAYNWILIQAAMRNSLARAGICGLRELEKRKLVIIGDTEETSENEEVKVCGNYGKRVAPQEKEEVLREFMDWYREKHSTRG